MNVRANLIVAAVLAAVAGAPVSADYVGLTAEAYTNPDMPPPSSWWAWTTYRVYAVFDVAGDQCITLAGDTTTPLIASTLMEFWHETTVGGDVEHDATQDPDVTGLHFDTYWTIGSTDASSAPVTSAFWNTGPYWTDGSFLGDDGAYYRIPTDPTTQAVHDPDSGQWRVLIGQFTVKWSGGLTVSGQFQVTVGGAFEIISDSVIVPPTTGACCVDEEVCLETTRVGCIDLEGTYQGDGSTCAAFSCTLGACCFADGNCAEWIQWLCDTRGGTWQGPWTGCTPSVCPPPPDPAGWVITVTETQLTNYASDYAWARIDGGVIVYTVEGPDYDSNVLAIDVDGTPYSIAFTDADEHWPDVSGDGVVYHIVPEQGGDGVVEMYDFRSGEINVYHSTTGYDEVPALSDGNLVWETNGWGPADIVWTNWESDSGPHNQYPITDTTFPDSYPDVDGNLAAWTGWEPGLAEIRAAVLELPWPPATFVVAGEPPPGYLSRPRVSGSLIAYLIYDDDLQAHDIAVYDHATGATKRITYDPYDQSRLAVASPYVLYTDDRNGNDDIFVHDLSTGIYFQLTDDPSDQVLTDADETTAVFHDDRVCSRDIYKVEWSVVANGTGACCLEDGTCADMLHSTCRDAGGAFLGDGTACGAPPCLALPTGACCLTDGACVEAPAHACANVYGGRYAGDGSACGGIDCPEPPAGYVIHVTEEQVTDWRDNDNGARLSGGTVAYISDIGPIIWTDVFVLDTAGTLWNPVGGCAYPGYQSEVDIDGHAIVYRDNSPDGPESFVVYDADYRTDGWDVVLDGPGWDLEASISGPNVVWRTERNGNWDIYWYYDVTGASLPLADTAADELDPVIDGTLVAWTVDDDIYAVELGGTPFPVAATPAFEGRPSISGDLIAFNRDGQVAVYDHVTGLTTQVTDEPVVHSDITVTGQSVLWTEGGSDHEVYMHDLPTGATFRLTFLGGYPELTDAEGNTAVFSAVRTDNLDVFRLTWTIESAPSCSGDTNGDGTVNVDDLNNVILDWGTDGSAHGGDVAGALPGDPQDGIVNVNDLNAVIVGWGACSGP